MCKKKPVIYSNTLHLKIILFAINLTYQNKFNTFHHHDITFLQYNMANIKMHCIVVGQNNKQHILTQCEAIS